MKTNRPKQQSLNPLTRRRFLQGAAAATGFTLLPGSALGLNGETPPSERIRTGHIGVGTQGGGHLIGGAWTHVNGGYAGRKDVQVMGVCDLRNERREEMVKAVNAGYAERFGQADYNGCTGHTDFREMIARDDIDAIVIACPLHWHAVMAIMAMEAGKDVYCEKPVAIAVEWGRALADTAKRTGRVFQAGTQQRSEFTGKFRLACQLVRSGRIGELKEVYAYRPGGGYAWPGGLGAPQPEPKDYNWDLFVGPAQWIPYDGNTGTFRFSGLGDINWSPHHYDYIHWVLDADRTGPVEIWMENGNPAYRYANGVIVYGAPYPKEPVGEVGGACFVGTKGRIAVDRDNIVSDPPLILKDPPAQQDIPLYPSIGHANNFIDCIRTRQRTMCDAETAHRAMTFVLLGGMELQLKRPLKWDPAAERFIGDDEANRLLSVTARPPWHI